MEKHVLSQSATPVLGIRQHTTLLRLLVLVLCLLWLMGRYIDLKKADFDRIQHEEGSSLSYLANHCANMTPILASEFHARQQALAEKLHELGAAAYIAEPGHNALYFANLSLSEWWISERPFLLVITPIVQNSQSGQETVIPGVSILTPRFELSRARLLKLPTNGNVTFLEWADSESPYDTVVSALHHAGQLPGIPKIIMDEDTRYFLVEGVRNGAPNFTVGSSPAQIRALRERKSQAELALLRCANEVTLMALREVQKSLYFGIRESEAKDLILRALKSAGLDNVEGLVLFGENAVLPHGSGTDRRLGEEDLALFDIMGSLHGYYSDLTRTVAFPQSRIAPDHLQVWYTVSAAQSAALRAARSGVVVSKVDNAARDVITSAGAGKYFTHRLGHGIGLQIHESPYLRGGSDAVIATGNVFSNEPGIYIEGQVGVRLEDCFFIDEQGLPVLLTAEVGGQARSPWYP